MKIDAIILAVCGAVLLAMLASNALKRRPFLKKSEPILAVCSLALLFLALQSSVTDSAEQSLAFRSPLKLQERFFKRHCERRLGGSVRLVDNMAYCIRGEFVTDQTQRPNDVPR
jgi:hypothetical protein